jgi:hypothetical protein
MVQRQDVEVGQMIDNQIIVASGVAEGDRIAAAGVHILREGQKVTVLESGGAAK